MLNIVVEECRTLSSRERCPFLVHIEVAETGLSGDDSRLYASGAPGLGATVEEALSMGATRANERTGAISGRESPAYQIPSELLGLSTWIETDKTNVTKDKVESVRGGYQTEDTVYHEHRPHDLLQSSPYDIVRQSEYEQLHQQMYTEPDIVRQPTQGDSCR